MYMEVLFFFLFSHGQFLVFGLCFQSVNITKCHILTKTADVIANVLLRMQYRASAVDKMKIEPALISFMEKMADQNDDFITKESCKSLSVFEKFQMDDKWSECRKLIGKFKNWFFFLVE